MGLKSTFKFVAYRLAELSLLALVIVFVPNLPPFASISESYRLPTFKPLTGKLAINNKLDDVELWHKGDLTGPEVIIDHKGELYTSLIGGDVVKLVGNDHIVPVVKFGKPCAHYYEEKLCGRPLGIQFGPDGYLYAMDAYYGLWKANVDTGEKELLVGPNDKINGVRPRIFNSIAVASNGEIFFSHSSSQFDLHDGVFDMLADPSGRLIRFNPKTKTKTVLIDKLAFANGVVLSDDEEFVLVAETMKARILRYYLKGPKQGTYDIFVDALPGLTDNLSRDGKGGFLAPLVLSTDEDHPLLNHILSPFPLIRRFILRLGGLTQWIFQNIDAYYPNEISKKAVYHIGHFKSLPHLLMNKRATVVRLSKDGEIIDSIHAMNNKINRICDAHIYKDVLLLGSFVNDYIARIPLSKVGWDDLRKDIREKRDTKPAETLKKEQETVQKKQAPPPNKAPEPARAQTTPPPVKKESSTPKPVAQNTTPPPAAPKQTAPPKVQTKPQAKPVESSKPPVEKQKVETKPQPAAQKPQVKPEAATQKPPQAAQEKKPPQAKQQKPEVVTQKPQATQQKPQVQQNAQATQQKPQGKPEVVTQKPQAAQQKPQVQQNAQAAQQKAQGKPEVVTQKPEATQQKPQATQGKPQVVTQKPQGTQQKPQATQEKPKVVTQKSPQPETKAVPQKKESVPSPKAQSQQKPATPSKQSPPTVAQPVKDQLNEIPINHGPKQ